MEVTAEFHGLIVHSRGHLSDNELREIQEFVEGRDFNLALETLCGFLIDRNRKVNHELFIRIHSLGERLDGVDPSLVESVRAIVEPG
ncbi:MAG TPA: hypothetical protein VJS19_08250 [Candidatus Dormibacteraeota bacterium]|nr:hypothetical protein [Candidatus Dormibacteraeota bacterium]